jgi:ATP-dependent RNA helicase MSS116
VGDILIFSIQMGLPSDREQYIHRLGRTGRKGKEGQGLLLLAPWEEFFLADVQDLPIKRDPLPEMHSEIISRVSFSPPRHSLLFS